MQSTPLIAFDQHAATTVAAVLLPGQRTPVLHSLTSDSPTILRFVQRLQREVGPIRCCYEAGPCGFELQRALTAAGVPCEVIAPALIPRRAGDRIKTDRRDAGHLAVLFRADALTEAFRDDVIRRHPRDGVTAEIIAAIKAETKLNPGGRFALLRRCGFLPLIRIAPFKGYTARRWRPRR